MGFEPMRLTPTQVATERTRPLCDPSVYGGEEGNRTPICWVQTNRPPVERQPHGDPYGNRTRDHLRDKQAF